MDTIDTLKRLNRPATSEWTKVQIKFCYKCDNDVSNNTSKTFCPKCGISLTLFKPK